MKVRKEQIDMTLSTIRDQARQAVTELLEKSSLPQGSLLVVGCSTKRNFGAPLS